MTVIIDEQAQTTSSLSRIARDARVQYAERVAGVGKCTRWWTAVIVTASSMRQAERYADEIRWRREQGKIPADVRYLVVPDLDDERIGSGGATINALRKLAELELPGCTVETLEDWWRGQRVLMIHSGGDARRLPQYSLSGKLFSVLPIKTPWGETSSVFDELLALSSPWAAQLAAGLVVVSGDVLPTFAADALHWERPGVSGVAMRQPMEIAGKHGVYVLGGDGRVYSFLQKPTAAQVRAAGGMLADDTAALDTGVQRFDATISARLTELAGVTRIGDRWEISAGILTRTNGKLPCIDLYAHFTMALTGEWVPTASDDPAWRQLYAALCDVPLWCDLVDGDFTHIGTTKLFRQLMTEETNFSALYAAQQRLGMVVPPGMRSAGVIVDSVLIGGELGSAAIAIECDLAVPVHASRGAILHGLTDLPTAVVVPEDSVVHQIPLLLPDGQRGTVIRVYGVTDDPKAGITGGNATWFGRPILEMLNALGLDPECVWAGIPAETRSLWNAQLFPLGSVEEAWRCAQWMLGVADAYSAVQWATTQRFSLANSAQWADMHALADARSHRMQHQWQAVAVSLAKSGTDIRPLLAYAPGVTALAAVGRTLATGAASLETTALTEAASQYFHAYQFLVHGGLAHEAEQHFASAYACVCRAVDAGVYADALSVADRHWHQRAVTVSAPARIDLGGGWSDTPPFCLDWGGTVLNIALTINGDYPITTSIRRLEEPCIRCISGDSGEIEEYHTTDALRVPPAPGCSFAIPRAALQMAQIVQPGEALTAQLRAFGGGIEIRTCVNLPMGSGLGTSSILAATMLQALAIMRGIRLSEADLSDQVMRLEQLLTTGGGWQDQAGGIFPGAKLISSGPGSHQRLRVQPLSWSPECRAEFAERLVLHYTGIRRVAKDLLANIVGRYLAREVATVQVLHSIKTLAGEMAYAMNEGAWDYLGQLLDSHWQLNQVLDEHTTNAPITAMLSAARPYLAGAKLAGAGGGGFLLLLAKSPEDAQRMREVLRALPDPGEPHEWTIADEGLRIECE